MKKIIAAALCAGLTTACATSPDKISAQYVSPMQYQAYSCDQLRTELVRVGARVGEVTGQQRKQANNDALAMGVGLVIFWPALFFLAGGSDKKDELGRLKGEYDALQISANEKSCNFAAPQTAAAPTAAAS